MRHLIDRLRDLETPEGVYETDTEVDESETANPRLALRLCDSRVGLSAVEHWVMTTEQREIQLLL